jgi:PIN domain nuclease of toxin-antitoxin system
MKLLLDSNILLWSMTDPGRLSAQVRADLEDRGQEILFSAASIWEFAIKGSKWPGALPIDAQEIFATALLTGFRELPVSGAVARHVATLPLLHRDPFDRILVAQAISEPAFLYTADAQLAPYSDLVRLM